MYCGFINGVSHFYIAIHSARGGALNKKNIGKILDDWAIYLFLPNNLFQPSAKKQLSDVQKYTVQNKTYNTTTFLRDDTWSWTTLQNLQEKEPALYKKIITESTRGSGTKLSRKCNKKNVFPNGFGLSIIDVLSENGYIGIQHDIKKGSQQKTFELCSIPNLLLRKSQPKGDAPAAWDKLPLPKIHCNIVKLSNWSGATQAQSKMRYTKGDSLCRQAQHRRNQK